MDRTGKQEVAETPIRHRVSWSGDEEFEVTTHFSPEGRYRTVLQIIDTPLEPKTRTREDAIAQFNRACDWLELMVRGEVMSKFRKKPVVIEARKVGNNVGDMVEVAEWAGGRFSSVRIGDVWSDEMIGIVEIPTLEGTMRANIGDWVIKGVNGEFYPCKDDIFQKTYDPVGTGE